MGGGFCQVIRANDASLRSQQGSLSSAGKAIIFAASHFDNGAISSKNTEPLGFLKVTSNKGWPRIVSILSLFSSILGS